MSNGGNLPYNMFNLLLESEKKTLQTEYKLRLVISVFTAIALLALTSILLLLPPYTLSVSKENLAEKKLSELRVENAKKQDSKLLATIKDADRKISLLAAAPTQELQSKILGEVLKEKTDSIKIKNLLYARASGDGTGNGFTIKISGIARDRVSLLEFSRRLTGNSRFARVNLPVSNFAKDEDISFTIEIQGK